MDRPRRSTRVPPKYTGTSELETASAQVPSLAGKKRKERTKEDKNSLEFVLSNPKSSLVSLELPILLNENTWSALSQDSKDLLSTLLPITTFPFFEPKLKSTHPSFRQLETTSDDMNLQKPLPLTEPCEPDISFFKDAFFDGACKTFQDNLFNGHYKADYEMLAKEYIEKLKLGDIHAKWKDLAWEEEHAHPEQRAMTSGSIAGDASSITLKDLIKNSAIRVGDILSYRRNFIQLGITVTKDALIESIQGSKNTITLVVMPSSKTHLPAVEVAHPEFASNYSDSQTDTLLRIDSIANPTQLETAFLDTDGRVTKSKRPNGNAWKSIGLWRWRDNEIPDITAFPDDSEEALRGYREYQGTLFYLRGCMYDDN
ncbi:hypothetical protein M422DRAFT_231568 [Sphaerobolus stellatus SS14]|uniref:ASX DEUBAD domain-containing protein n=1 Tax=Sphaerobolus stellatus (strain SS14) TaxID=990650 RepID=A0A0C9VIY0_SPHS4|nr:hypothetical protein M422DRAFT_231568 [Sphaerobolus stellatus SS14]